MKIPWWMCELERYFFNHADWKLVHDGQRNPGQFEFPPKDVRCFTRRYRTNGIDKMLGIHGIIFRYDLRGVVADVKFEFSSENGHKKKKVVFEQVK